MREKELSICIWIHHIATFIGISEGLYYLLAGKQGFIRSCGVFLLTAFQSLAGFKILVDLRNGQSRLADSYRNLEKVDSFKRQKRGILWGLAVSSSFFKIFPVHILGHS